VENCDKFFRLSEAAFSFLSELFGFKIEKRESELYGCYIYFANATTGVRVSYEPYEGGVFVQLSELVDEQFPRYEIHVRDDSVLRTFYLQDLRRVRGEKPFDDTGEDVEEVLSSSSAALRESGELILRGDFREFVSLADLVKKRARELRNGPREP